jgi:hypothetical protein
MRTIHLLIVILSMAFLMSCSTNENEPLASNSIQETMTLAVNKDAVYYLSLEEAGVVTVADPMVYENWDIRISNLARVELRGGATAPGNGYAAAVENMTYEDMSTAPNVLYATDTQDGPFIGDNWYIYDITTHIVHPITERFYVLHTAAGKYFKFQIFEVEFPSPTDGELRIRFEEIAQPSSPEFQSANGRVCYTMLRMSTSEQYFFNLKQVSEVSVTDPMNSQDWDLKTEYVTVKLNGGSNGNGMAGAQLLENVDFDSITVAPASGYADDAVDTPAIGNSWYTYDPSVHTLNCNDLVYIIRTAAGNYAKIQFVQSYFAEASAGSALVRYEYIEGTDQF